MMQQQQHQPHDKTTTTTTTTPSGTTTVDNNNNNNNNGPSKSVAGVDPKTHVLLVEDNLVNQKMMIAMLKRLGHKVTAVGNGLEAIQQVEQHKFGVVLMDVQMPVMDGIEATKQIRRMGYTKRKLPVLALTASVRTSEHENIGVNDWLTKPLRPRDLKRAISDSLLSSSSSSSSQKSTTPY